MGKNDIQSIMKLIQDFVVERDWQKFHSVKNLSSALCVESAELLELSTWLSEAESNSPSSELIGRYSEEIADVMIYALRLCQVLELDPLETIVKKVELNKRKYPVELSFGNATKYNKLGGARGETEET